MNSLDFLSKSRIKTIKLRRLMALPGVKFDSQTAYLEAARIEARNAFYVRLLYRIGGM